MWHLYEASAGRVRGAVTKLSSNRGALGEVKSQKQTCKKAILPCPKVRQRAQSLVPAHTPPTPTPAIQGPPPTPSVVISLLRLRPIEGVYSGYPLAKGRLGLEPRS